MTETIEVLIVKAEHCPACNQFTSQYQSKVLSELAKHSDVHVTHIKYKNTTHSGLPKNFPPTLNAYVKGFPSIFYLAKVQWDYAMTNLSANVPLTTIVKGKSQISGEGIKEWIDEARENIIGAKKEKKPVVDDKKSKKTAKPCRILAPPSFRRGRR